MNNCVLGYRDAEATALRVPSGVLGVGNHAFADFWDLQSVNLPDSLKYIGCGAFETNTYLDNLLIPDGVELICDQAFQGCTYLRNLVIGEGVRHIGNEAFARCSQLATVGVPDGVLDMGDGVFSNCWRLLSARLPLGLETIGTGMFAGCTALTGVTMPAHSFTVQDVFGEQFQKLESIAIVDGETAVCSNAFMGCTALVSVSFPDSLEGIGDSAFAECPQLAEIELPETLQRIGIEAFARCTALSSIVFPDSVRNLGARAFVDCGHLSNVTLSRSLEGVPDQAFQGCRNLTSMVIPASVKTLGARIGEAFTALYYLGNAPAYDENAYAGISAWNPITTYVVNGSRGWDGIPSSRDLPESWLGYPITYWEPNRFDAHFDANGGVFADGSAVWSCEQITGVGYVLPPYAPTLVGADFDGWWTDPAAGAQIKATTRVNETREITFYAHWKGSPVPVTVRFNANGGTVVPTEKTYQATMPYGALPVPTRKYYRFDGWWTAADGGNKIVATSRVPGADQELFAHWTPETYAIRFHSNGGEGVMADQAFTYGSPVVLRSNAFWRAEWEFSGWAVTEDGAAVYADGAVFSEISAIEDGVIHLYAVWWRGGTYAVRFDSNGGTGQMDNQTFTIGEKQALSPCAFSREGFRFIGWGTVPRGEVVYTDCATVLDLTTEPDAAVVLYAVWEKEPEPEVLPEIDSDSKVAEVMAGATDGRLAEKIQTVADYAAFREWALGVKGRDGEVAGAEAVMASEHAWASYLLGADILFENEPTIQIGGLSLDGGAEGSRAPGTSWEIRVTVKDGENVASVDADKVAALFEATRQLGDWTEASLLPLSVTAKGSDGDTILFDVTPAEESAPSAFLRLGE